MRKVFIIITIIFLIYSSFQLYEELSFQKKISKMPVFNISLDFESININEINLEHYFIIDTREIEEFNLGHVKGAYQFRTSDIIRDNKTFNKILTLSQGKPLLLYCYESNYLGDNAGRSGLAASYLKQNNIESYVIKGGVSELSKNKNIWIEKNGFEIFPNLKKRKNNLNSELIIDVNHKEMVLMKDSNIIYNTNFTSGDMTSKEWDSFLNYISQFNKNISIGTTCYDNPTCFFANILGIRITNLGFDFEGYQLR